jgi:hypothetical protein
MFARNALQGSHCLCVLRLKLTTVLVSLKKIQLRSHLRIQTSRTRLVKSATQGFILTLQGQSPMASNQLPAVSALCRIAKFAAHPRQKLVLLVILGSSLKTALVRLSVLFKDVILVEAMLMLVIFVCLGGERR